MKICPKCGNKYSLSARLCEHDQETLEVEDPEPGTVVGGRYRLESVLGKGGMGVVYVAQHIALEKAVALKFLRGHLADDPVVLKRFQREARSASAINHPGIIDVTDFGDDPEHGVFFTMEFVEGGELSAEIKQEGALAIAEATNIAAEVADALHAAHENGIIHRDLKPDNILLEKRPGKPPQPKIMDFGIAGVADDDGTTKLTQAGSVFGTPAYMSPEQATGGDVDRRTDIYAFGVILYEMVTGARPFDAKDMLSLLEMQCTAIPEAPSLRNPAVSPGLQSVILRCMGKLPEDRFATMAEVRDLLLLGDDLGAETVAPGPDFGGGSLASMPAIGSDAGPPAGGRSKLPLVLALVALLAVGAGAWFFLFSGDEPAEPVAAAAPAEPADEKPKAKAEPEPKPEPEPEPPKPFARLLRSEPAGAEVYEEAAFVGRTPLKLELKQGQDAREVELRAPGFVSQQGRGGRDAEDALDVRLKEDAPVAPPKKRKKRKKRRKKKGKGARGLL